MEFEFEEGSPELERLIELGQIEKPAIAKLPWWSELKQYIRHSKSAGAARGHTYLQSDTPEPLIKKSAKAHVPCSNPDCTNSFPAIRKHRNGKLWSIHVSGVEANGHQHCRHRVETSRQTQWLYLVTKQQGRSLRVRKSRENARQGRFKINSDNELTYL